MMEATINSSRTRVRLPYGIKALLSSWHRAFSHLLDSRATLRETEEMYAVFEETSMCYALAILSVGFSRYVQETEIDAEETKTHILLRLTGKCRAESTPCVKGGRLALSKAAEALLDETLARSGAAYLLGATDGKPVLTVSLPRFLADRYDVATSDADDMCDRFYEMMLFLSGDLPEEALLL